MNDAELRAAVRPLVADLVQHTLDPADDDHALAELAPERYDSLAVLDCVGIVEQRFGISIDLVDDDLRMSFRSVRSIAELVARKLRDMAALGVGR